MSKVLGITGHRPHKLGGYTATHNFDAIRNHMRNYFLERGDISLVVGGALGIDEFALEIGLEIGLKVVAALPFRGYDDMWPSSVRTRYAKLLDKCEDVVYISEPPYTHVKMMKRNEWIVDHSNEMVAYFNGDHKRGGGTANCIKYAAGQGKPITIFNTDDIITAGHVARFSK